MRIGWSPKLRVQRFCYQLFVLTVNRHNRPFLFFMWNRCTFTLFTFHHAPTSICLLEEWMSWIIFCKLFIRQRLWSRWWKKYARLTDSLTVILVHHYWVKLFKYKSKWWRQRCGYCIKFELCEIFQSCVSNTSD